MKLECLLQSIASLKGGMHCRLINSADTTVNATATQGETERPGTSSFYGKPIFENLSMRILAHIPGC